MECLARSVSGNALLMEYVAGRVWGRDAARVAQHLRECEICGAQAEGQQKIWELLDCWEAVPVSTGFNRRLYARIQESAPARLHGLLARLLTRWVARPAMPIAALSLLAIAGFYLERPQPPVARPATQASPAVVSPRDAEQLDKALDDLQLLHQLDLVKDEAANASKAM